MIRYRRLYESENSGIKLYDTVRCAGYDWYVIGIEDDVVTLLLKYCDLSDCKFDPASNDYKTSEIRKHLRYKVLPELQSANPIPTRLNDVGCTDKVWLLSVDEAKKLPQEIRNFDDWWWWLRSPGWSDRNGSECNAANVHGDVVDTFGSNVNYRNFVRPVMKVRTEDLN